MKSFFTFSMATCLLMFLFPGCSKDDSASISLSQSSDVVVTNRSVYKTSGKSILPLDVLWFGNCTGEYVHVTGQIVLTYNVIQKGGSSNYATQFHYQNTKGVGMSSGNTYNIVGNNSTHLYLNFSFDNYTKTSSTSGRIMWITSGKDNNIVAIARLKVTQNGQGELVINKDSYTLTCE